MTREELKEEVIKLAGKCGHGPGTAYARAVLYFLASAMVMGKEDQLSAACEKANVDNLRQLNAQNN